MSEIRGTPFPGFAGAQSRLRRRSVVLRCDPRESGGASKDGAWPSPFEARRFAPAPQGDGERLRRRWECKLREGEVIYVELAKRLKKHGFKSETEASITNKLRRGTFSATFFLACLAALDLDGVALEEI